MSGKFDAKAGRQIIFPLTTASINTLETEEIPAENGARCSCKLSYATSPRGCDKVLKQEKKLAMVTGILFLLEEVRFQDDGSERVLVRIDHKRADINILAEREDGPFALEHAETHRTGRHIS